jgi:predicted deacylase
MRLRSIPLLAAALAVSAAIAGPVAAKPPAGGGPWVVRAQYADPSSLALLQRRAAPWRVDRRAREVLIEVEDGFAWTLLEREGFVVRVDAELTRALNHPPAKSVDQVTGIPGYACYRTVEETYAAAEALVAAHPGLAQWIDIGDSWRKQQNAAQGYDLRVLRITNDAIAGPKPVLFLQSAIHAREYVTAETVTRFAEQLLGGYGTDADSTWIVDHHELHLVLVANPDGRKVAETAATRLQRKNRNGNWCAAGATTMGVDLNRNYPWSYGSAGSSTTACSDIFRGPSALSEPELQAITTHLRNVVPDQRAETSLGDRTTPVSLDTTGFFIDIHSNGAGNWFPWGDTTAIAPNGAQMQSLARKLEYYNGYEAIQGALTGVIGGASDDYAFGTLGIPGFTMELGGSDFWPACTVYESSIAGPTIASLRFAARIVRAPYRLPSGPEIVAATANPVQVPSGGSTTLTLTADDTRFGPGTGPEPAQAIQQVAVWLSPPWQAGGSPLGVMDAVDGALDETSEAMRYELSGAALAPGRQLVWLQATDAAGNRGPVAAVFVDGPEGTLFSDGFED